MLLPYSTNSGLTATLTILRRQITSMPCGLYEIRLIHSCDRRPYPGTRLWPESLILNPATVSFLRIRNREGFDVYFRPYADVHNAGYILLDLDSPDPGVLSRMRAQGHQPSVVLETSPGRLQAWIRVSQQPLPPAIASAIGMCLARQYQADLASADWRHLGRLAGFTNRKPQRQRGDGLAPWVKLLYAHGHLASGSQALLEQASTPIPVRASAEWSLRRGPLPQMTPSSMPPRSASGLVPGTGRDSRSLRACYQTCLSRLRILERYPSPDWSIIDKWIARELLADGASPANVQAVLCHGSPGFPRRHADPQDYLRRTIACAARQIHSSVFPARTAHPWPH